jgi:hypothetical protein
MLAVMDWQKGEEKNKSYRQLPRTGIEPVILSLLVTRFTTEPTGLVVA